MISWVPPHVHAFRGEAPEAAAARYQSIAEDLATVTLEEAPVFAGTEGRARTALVMLAITRYESGGWRADIDRQDRPTGDGGKAWCLAQLHAPFAEGLTDRKSCFRGELAALRESRRMCPGGTFVDGLSGYTVGTCVTAEKHARLRFELATSWWARHPFASPDAD